MAPVPVTVAALLDVARQIMAQSHPDVDELLMLLANMPVDDLDVQTRGAVVHARHVAAAAQDKSGVRTAVARFALARVVVLLERHVTSGVS